MIPTERPASAVVIREARRQDSPAIVSLWKEMMDFHGEYDRRFRFGPEAPREFERHLAQTLRSREARIYVADTADGPVGYIIGEMHSRKPLYPTGTYGFISDISVAEAWRRRGIGRGMVEAMMRWFLERRATAVELFVADANPVSMAFWRAMGFGDFLRLQRRELNSEGQT